MNTLFNEEWFIQTLTEHLVIHSQERTVRNIFLINRKCYNFSLKHCPCFLWVDDKSYKMGIEVPDHYPELKFGFVIYYFENIRVLKERYSEIKKEIFKVDYEVLNFTAYQTYKLRKGREIIIKNYFDKIVWNNNLYENSTDELDEENIKID